MNDIFRAKEKNHALHGEEGQVNYRDFGHWADMADEAESAKEFEESAQQEQVEQLKKYVVKRTDIKGRDADYTDEEKTTIARETVQSEFRKRTGMTFQEFFANVKADSVAASE
jgi:hypothetical protein